MREAGYYWIKQRSFDDWELAQLDSRGTWRTPTQGERCDQPHAVGDKTSPPDEDEGMSFAAWLGTGIATGIVCWTCLEFFPRWLRSKDTVSYRSDTGKDWQDVHKCDTGDGEPSPFNPEKG